MSLRNQKKWQIALQSLIAAGTLTLVGCDGGSVKAGDGSNLSDDGLAGDAAIPGDDRSSSEGTLISQRGSGAKLCFDINSNDRCDTLEPSDVAAEDGSFTLVQDKVPGTIVAEIADDENGNVVRLYADHQSPTVSALTTVLHWSVQANPNVAASKVADDLMQLLALDDLDSSAPETPAATPPADDSGESGDESGDESAEDSEPETDDEEAPSYSSVVRQSIELLIGKVTAAAQADALAAGLDPGMDSNQTLLSRLVADQSLTQLTLLADALSTAVDPDPQALVDALPAITWPADDIVLAMQMFAGDAAMEADPITLLQEGLNGLMEHCESASECELQQQTLTLDDSMNFSTAHYTVLADGSLEAASTTATEVSNLVLNSAGEWEMLDTSGMGTVSRTGEYLAEMLDGNDDNFALRATARTISDTPVAPLLDTLGLAPEDFSNAQANFGDNAKLVTLQREQLNNRYEMLYQPSEDTLERAAAQQTLAQAEVTLDKLERDFAAAGSALTEAEFDSLKSTEAAEEAEANVAALEAASESIEQALAAALLALDEASANSAAVEESAALIAAYASVLQDAEENVAQAESANSEAAAELTAAGAAQAAAATAVEAANEALDNALAAQAEAEAEAEAENAGEGEEEAQEPATEDSEEVQAARAAKLQAERDLIVADADLADATAAAASAATALETAEQELDNASAALADAEANQVTDGEAEQALQSAQLLVSANEANLALITGQIEQAEAELAILSEQADADAELWDAAQTTLDSLATRVATATDDLAAAQAAVDSGEQTVVTSGCEEALPAQAADNYNCAAIERRIGDAPTTAVPTLAELTATQSALTLLKLHPDFAVTMLPSNGENSGSAAWHDAAAVYDANDTALPQSSWSKLEVNGVQMISVEVPAALLSTGDASELLMAEQDNYVRPGLVVSAGDVSHETLLNDEALQAILP